MVIDLTMGMAMEKKINLFMIRKNVNLMIKLKMNKKLNR